MNGYTQLGSSILSEILLGNKEGTPAAYRHAHMRAALGHHAVGKKPFSWGNPIYVVFCKSQTSMTQNGPVVPRVGGGGSSREHVGVMKLSTVAGTWIHMC